MDYALLRICTLLSTCVKEYCALFFASSYKHVKHIHNLRNVSSEVSGAS
jgi:hypothetical protein